ncbi:MAG: signal peptidase I [Clostridia bacterium]|nr:signal peptidase I [Clostridia bacterium]
MAVTKKVLNILSKIVIIILVLILLINLYTIFARKVLHIKQPTVFGYSYAVVLTGSMEPSIKPGSMIITKAQENYEVRDIITYDSGTQTPVTHRIVRIEDGKFIARGDANNTEDLFPIEKKAVIGKVVAVMPNVGRAINFLGSPIGMMMLVLIAALIIEIPILFGKKEEN